MSRPSRGGSSRQRWRPSNSNRFGLPGLATPREARPHPRLSRRAVEIRRFASGRNAPIIAVQPSGTVSPEQSFMGAAANGWARWQPDTEDPRRKRGFRRSTSTFICVVKNNGTSFGPGGRADNPSRICRLSSPEASRSRSGSSTLDATQAGENNAMRATRRQILKTAAAAGSLPLVHLRTAGAAGRLRIGFIGSSGA